jgi:hypothetical protein
MLIMRTKNVPEIRYGEGYKRSERVNGVMDEPVFSISKDMVTAKSAKNAEMCPSNLNLCVLCANLRALCGYLLCAFCG